MMNVLNVPSERFAQIDSIINFGNIAPCVPTERCKHHESFFYPSFVPTGHLRWLKFCWIELQNPSLRSGRYCNNYWIELL